MNKNVTNTVLACVAFMALLIGLLVNRVLAPTVMSNEQLNENGLFVYDVPRRFEDFTLADHNQEPFTLSNLQGQWTLIFFGYTYCPDICPLTLATLSQFSGLLEGTEWEDDTQVIMVSVDPERDTLEKLRDYVGFFNSEYLGVTGEYIEIFNLARQLNVAFGYQPLTTAGAQEGDYLVNHSGEIILINPNGHFHGFFKVPHAPEKMAENYFSVRATWD